MFDWFFRYQWEIYALFAIVILICASMYNVVYHIDIGEPGWPVSADAVHTYKTNKNYMTQPSSCDSRGEKLVRACLETKFHRPFAKARPILNPVTKQYLELDCYNADLGLAAEYQGKQHYKYTPFFHKNKEAFRNQQYRDELKRIACRQHGIHLIEIPYWIPFTKIESYLNARLPSGSGVSSIGEPNVEYRHYDYSNCD